MGHEEGAHMKIMSLPWGYTNSSMSDANQGQDCRVNSVTSIFAAALL